MSPSSTWREARRTACRRGLAALVLMAALVVSGSAGAESRSESRRQKARTEFDTAQIQFKLGHFQDALDAYSRAYELFPAPAFLFNIGQCHKNLKNFERAIFFFEGYLRDETNPTKRALAEEVVAESRIELERQGARNLAAKPNVEAALTPTIEAAPATTGTPDAGGEAPSGTTPARDAFALGPAALPARSAAAVVEPAIGVGATGHEPSKRLTQTWWFWTAIGALAVTGGLLYLGSGGTTRVPPDSSVGTLDRR